jgi:hypothetical protein
MMERLRTRAELFIKWQFTESRRARAVWIDGQMGARSHAVRSRTGEPKPGTIRRLI